MIKLRHFHTKLVGGIFFGAVLWAGIHGTSLAVLPPSEVRVPDFQTYVFSGTVPAEFAAGEHSRLSIDTTHYRQDATSSLQWEWDQPGASFTFTHPEAFKHLTGENPDPVVYGLCTTMCKLSAMEFWVYNDTPFQEAFWFEIGDDKSVDTRFWIDLSSVGWHHVLFFYGRDLDGFPNQRTATTLRVTAPPITRLGSISSKGVLYFSQFCPRTETDVRRGTTEVTPWVGTRAKMRRANWGPGKFFPTVLPEPTQDELKAMDALAGKILGPRNPVIPVREVKAEEFEELRASIEEKHKIAREGDKVTGGWTQDIFASMGKVAELYVASKGQPGIQARAEHLFYDLLDLLVNEGSIVRSGGYKLSPTFATPFLIMRDSLHKSGKFELAMQWVRNSVEMDEIYLVLEGNAFFIDSNWFFNQAQIRLKAILLGEEPRRKLADLRAFQRCLEACADHGGFQSDGVFNFHGIGMYAGYCIPAMDLGAWPVSQLHGTPFATPKLEAKIRQVDMNIAFMSNGAYIPHFFGGRWHNLATVGWNNWVKLSRINDKDQEPDRELASTLMWVADARAKIDSKFSDNLPEIQRCKKLCIKPCATPQGHLSLNGANAGIHRRSQWVVTARGQKRGTGAYEIYGISAANSLGRYQNYGAIHVLSKGNPPTELESGLSGFDMRLKDGVPFTGDGWNWSLWPGTTSLLLPHEPLRSHFAVEEGITAEPFCGDASLDGNGVWAMKLQEEIPGLIDPERIGPPRYWLGEERYWQLIKESHYDSGFRARKSVFMFDNRLVCLGSGIVSTDPDYPAVTTIFQNSLKLDGRKEHFVLNGKAGVAVFPLENDLPADKPSWFINSADTGFYIPAGNAPVRLERKRQNLPIHPCWDPDKPEMHELVATNEGDMELAYFNHGKKAANGNYEYAMLIDTNPEQMKRFAAGMNGSQHVYTILQQDEAAHVVKDRESGMTGYAIFEAAWKPAFPDSAIQNVTVPCVLLCKDAPKGRMRLSFCNPDQGSQYAIGGSAHEAEQIGSVLLKGRWALASESKEASIKNTPEGTLVTFRTYGAKSTIIELEEQGKTAAKLQ